MAIVREIMCGECGGKVMVTNPSGGVAPDLCSYCEAGVRAKHLAEYLTQLDSLSLEARLRKIELWIYKHKDAKLYPTKY